MANLKIIPYNESHGDDIIAFGMNDKLMEIDASFSESRIDIAIPGLSYTLLVDNQPILAGGIYPLWDGVAEGWVLSSKSDYKIKSAISIKRRLVYFVTTIMATANISKESFTTGVGL